MCLLDPTMPDAGGGACCMGAAVYGPGGCTCWKPIYDRPQSKKLQQGPLLQRETMCDDCAFRPGSPERSGDRRYHLSGKGELDDLIYSQSSFACHIGMRRRVRLEHPTGAVVEVAGGYDPAKTRDRSWKADGSPSELCAGLRAARLKLGLL